MLSYKLWTQAKLKITMVKESWLILPTKKLEEESWIKDACKNKSCSPSFLNSLSPLSYAASYKTTKLLLLEERESLAITQDTQKHSPLKVLASMISFMWIMKSQLLLPLMPAISGKKKNLKKINILRRESGDS